MLPKHCAMQWMQSRWEMNMFKYGMRLRGFAPLCQPKEGLHYIMDDPSGRYYDILVYDRKLTDKELSDYELDYLGEYYG